MIIFLDDDAAYMRWITHHRRGFVVDGRRHAGQGHVVLHRAICSHLKPERGARAHATTGQKLKACALDQAALEDWALAEYGAAAHCCPDCQPDVTSHTDLQEPAHLTKLGAEILDYILDAALIHMEHDYPPYHLTVGDIAACFGKTVGQLTPALETLVADGFLADPPSNTLSSRQATKCVVYPTAQALRTLASFQAESDDALAAELAKLHAS